MTDVIYDRLVDRLAGGDVVAVDARELSAEGRARIVDAARVLHAAVLAEPGAGVLRVQVGPARSILPAVLDARVASPTTAHGQQVERLALEALPA